MSSWWNSTETVSNLSLLARWVGALLAIVILVLGNRVTALQSRDKAALQEKTDLKISQNERDTSSANARAEEAKKTAEGFRLDIATANERAASAEQKAAQFNEIAERERLARLQLEDKLKYRSISPAQIAEIGAKLRGSQNTSSDMILCGSTMEIAQIGASIRSATTAGGWKANGPWSAMGGLAVTGVFVCTQVGSDASIESAADALVAALNSAGIATGRTGQYKKGELPAALTGPDWSQDTAPIRIFIGEKP